MSQEIAVIVKDGQNVVSTNTVMEGSGATGRPLIVKAGSKQSIELKNIATGVAPDQIHVTKDGKNLKIKLGKKASDADDSSDIIIEGYYDNDASLVGVAENGQYYNFIPQGANPDSSYYSLGGDVIGTATETDWLPIALALLGAGALAALAGGGGGGGGSKDATPPASPTITLIDDAGTVTGEMPIKGANTGSNVANGTVGGNTITDDNTPTIIGITEAGATVTAADDAGNTLGSDTADSNGNYSITPTTPLSDGQHYIVVTATDAAGNSSQNTSIIFTVDTIAPGIPTINPTDGSPITGTAEAGSTVTITDDNGNPIGTTIADGNGNFIYTPATPLPHGTVITATATDAAGNVSDPGTTTVNSAVPDAPIVYDDVVPIIGDIANNTNTNDTKPTIEGSGAGAGRPINVYDNGVLLGATTSDVSGNWSLEPATAFANGSEHSITYTVNSGPQSPAVNFTVDTIAPSSVSMTLTDDVAPVTGAIANGSTTNDNKPTISGHTEAGATVTIKDGATTLGTVIADSNGNYAFTPTTSLSEGAHSVNVIAADDAGNSITSTTTNFTVDTIAPSSVSLIVTDNVAPDTGVIANNGITDDSTPTISGKTEAGATVTIKDGTTTLGIVAADNNGNYEFTPTTPLSIDSHSISATATDAAGNSTTSAHTAFTITPPAVIDLGDGNGQLINPVFVDGNYYYYWDKDGDGLGMVNGNPDQGDWFTHNELDAIFKYDSNGDLRPGNLNDTNDTYRYADINGYHLALPTYGGDKSNDGTQVATGIDNVPPGEINPTYDDLVAIWDAFERTNGSNPENGTPPGWATGFYWSATTYETTQHYAMDFATAHGGTNAEINPSWVAVQVIF